MHPLIFGLLIVTLPASAQAYFDPGTGSLIIQSLIGAIAGVAVFWGQLKAYVRAKLSSLSNEESAVSTDTENHGKDSADSES